MATERPESQKSPEPEKTGAEAQANTAAAAGSGGIKAWIPLLANVVLMPVVAYFSTTMLLAPKLKGGHAASGAHEAPTGHGEGAAAGGKTKFTVPLNGKVLVNISGTAGTRYLLANLSLVGAQATLKESVEKNEAELRDVAAGVLSTKTIADLEKPGARNLIRAELISVFNNVLGEGAVQELFLTEFAIQ